MAVEQGVIIIQAEQDGCFKNFASPLQPSHNQLTIDCDVVMLFICI